MNSNIKKNNKKGAVVWMVFATVIFTSGIVQASAKTYAATPVARNSRAASKGDVWENDPWENNGGGEKNDGRSDLLAIRAALERAKKNPVSHIAGLDAQYQTYLQRAYVSYKKRIENGVLSQDALRQYIIVIDAIIQAENVRNRGFFRANIIDPVVAGGKTVVSYAVAPFVNTYQGLKKRDKNQLMRGIAGLGAYAACFAAYYGLYIAPRRAEEAVKERERQEAQVVADRVARELEAQLRAEREEADRRRAGRDERNALRADRRAVGVGSDECPTCMVEEENEFIRFRCNHGMCRGCLTGPNGPIAIAVRERDFANLRCPVAGCRAVWAYDIAHYLSAETIFGEDFNFGEKRLGGRQESLGSRFEALDTQFLREDRPGYTKCPQDGCQWSTILLNERRQDVRCGACRHNYCSECRRESHEGMTCAQARRVAQVQNPVELPDGIKQCPHCHRGVERTEGCNHMTCRAVGRGESGQGCNHEFCWVCLADWDANHYACVAGANRPADNGHFRPANGGYYQF